MDNTDKKLVGEATAMIGDAARTKIGVIEEYLEVKEVTNKTLTYFQIQYFTSFLL